MKNFNGKNASAPQIVVNIRYSFVIGLFELVFLKAFSTFFAAKKSFLGEKVSLKVGV